MPCRMTGSRNAKGGNSLFHASTRAERKRIARTGGSSAAKRNRTPGAQGLRGTGSRERNEIPAGNRGRQTPPHRNPRDPERAPPSRPSFCSPRSRFRAYAHHAPRHHHAGHGIGYRLFARSARAPVRVPTSMQCLHQRHLDARALRFGNVSQRASNR